MWRQSTTATLQFRQVVHDAMTGGGMGQPQSADNRQGFAAAVADDADAIDPEQQSSSVLGMVQSLLDALEIASQECRADLSSTSTGKLSPQDAEQHAAHRFEKLEQNIAGESVADDDIKLSGQHIPAFAVPGEMQTLFVTQEFKAAESQVISLALLLTDVEQADAGATNLQDITAVDVPKQCELMQVGGLAVHVGPHIQHQHRLTGILGREQGPDGWTIDSLEPAQPKDG